MERLEKLQPRFEKGDDWSDDESFNDETYKSSRGFFLLNFQTQTLIFSIYLKSKETIFQTANQIFVDTSEEFSSINEIKKVFENWKWNNPQSYKKAYCSSSLPTIFGPFVRLEMLKWRPFYYQDKTELQTMNWHKLLFNYGMNQVKEFSMF